MTLFAQLIRSGGAVVEVGGHIGFVSVYFSSLVGALGRVIVFEPGANNLPYIRENIKRASLPGRGNNVRLVECAVGSRSGTATLFEDSLTGQNNSMIKDFPGLRVNKAVSYVATDVQEHVVPMTTIDDFFARDSLADPKRNTCSNDTLFWEVSRKVDFLKIDVEGFEYEVLSGAAMVISTDQPVIMVEVQADHDNIFKFLNAQGYRMFTDAGVAHTSGTSLKGNVFCLHPVAHKDYFQAFGAIE